MSNYRTYNDMDIEVIRATVDPEKLVAMACTITQKKSLDNCPTDLQIDRLISYLFKANHTSPFEHVSMTVLIQGVSRSFLAQITRHRMGSFTSASQHYTTYDKFPNIVSPELINAKSVESILEHADSTYEYLISVGIPKEEARQVLPNAKAVNILWTVNARSLINFFNQRLCRRNVEEMFIFSRKLLIICNTWFPELFSLVGPDCKTLGGCRQGKMKATECIKNDIPNFERQLCKDVSML